MLTGLFIGLQNVFKESIIKIIALKKAHFDIADWLRVHSSLCDIRQYILLLFSLE